jgi:hypothetical protein
MTALLLTAEELVAITRRERPSAQARILRSLGVPFAAHPDGSLLVSRASAEAVLRGEGAKGDDAPPAVNVDAIKGWSRGKTARAARP